jgi:hypothetical protein
VIENDAWIAPEPSAGSQRCCCAGVPWRRSSVAASPDGLTAPVSEIHPRESARQTGTSSASVRPGPPNSPGTSAR